MRKSGFTLLELLIVISIISMLAILGFTSYINSLKSAKDGRRKADLQTIQKGLETYYQDNNSYPTDAAGSVPVDPLEPNSFCHPSGCDVAKYLETLPKDPGGSNYVYESDGTYYKLYSCLENVNDNGPGVKQDGYGPDCSNGAGGRCQQCHFGISSTNTTP